MNAESSSQTPAQPTQERSKKPSSDLSIASKTILALLILAIVSSFFAIVGAGERGVLMLKAIVAQYTAEEIITKRSEVKAEVDQLLRSRLAIYHIAINDISLVHVHFSERFSGAVEAKQIAEQEAKRAGFMAQKAMREAEVRVNLARGEAEAHRLILDTLTPEILRRQAIERWDGKLPLIAPNSGSMLFDLELEDLMTANQHTVKQLNH